MKIEIDQSGKIENTNKLTAIAFSNNHQKSLIITAKDKKSVQSIFRRIGQPKIFVYKLFATAVFVLIKDDLKKLDQIIIDKEYLGYEKIIKKFILEIAEHNNKKIDGSNIHFHSIGKKSQAHKIALRAFQTKRSDIKLTSKDFFEISFTK